MTLATKYGRTLTLCVTGKLSLHNPPVSSNAQEVRYHHSLLKYAQSHQKHCQYAAPQKIMNMAWDRYRTTKREDTVKVEFWTGMPTMFSVKKYSDALDELRRSRGIHAEFSHNLTSIDVANQAATFQKSDGSSVTAEYTLLHVTPQMGPLDFIKSSPLADAAGWVSVDDATLQHKNPEYSNVFALGDCSSLPTSKTAAAITSQAPVLTENVFSFVDTGKLSNATYDGYTSCPVSPRFLIVSYKSRF